MSYLATSLDFHCFPSQSQKKKRDNNFQDLLLEILQALTQNYDLWQRV